MTKRLILLTAVVVCAAIVVACGGGDDSPDDARRGQVGSVSENATYAWIDGGASGLYDYLSQHMTLACTLMDVQVRLADRVQPTDWRQAKDFAFQEDGVNPVSATATVILATDGGDAEEQWSFVLEGESWRISAMPGLEECSQ